MSRCSPGPCRGQHARRSGHARASTQIRKLKKKRSETSEKIHGPPNASMDAAGGPLLKGCCNAATFAAITAAHNYQFLSRTTSLRHGQHPVAARDSEPATSLPWSRTVARDTTPGGRNRRSAGDRPVFIGSSALVLLSRTPLHFRTYSLYALLPNRQIFLVIFPIISGHLVGYPNRLQAACRKQSTVWSFTNPTACIIA